MNTNPLVSVVLGTYNGEKYLEEQIFSILRQTYAPVELILTDDGSTDRTPEILEEFAGKYANVHAYFSEANLGLTRNFERGVRYAQGQYIAFADQDDLWLPEKIRRLAEQIGDHMLAYADSAYVNAEGHLMGKKLSDYRHMISGSNLYALDPDSGIWVAAHAMLFRRELLDLALPFPSYLNHDTWLAYIAMLKGGIRYVPEVMTLYRQHEGNMVGGLGCHHRAKRKAGKVSRSEKRRQVTGQIDALLSRAPDTDPEFRAYLVRMRRYTVRPSFLNRIRRMVLRLQYIRRIYEPRKRNLARKIFKAIKSF
jgi:glycosyltransferase involved in cell wall biosynthesis